MPSEGAAQDVDVTSATSMEQLAQLLQRLRAQYGDPSMQELEDRSLKPSAGRRIPLSRATISAVLNGRRLAGHDFLVSYLTALGVPAADQPPWLEARAKIAEAQFPMDETVHVHAEDERTWPNSELLGDFPNSRFPTDRPRYLDPPPRYLPSSAGTGRTYPKDAPTPRTGILSIIPKRRRRRRIGLILVALVAAIAVGAGVFFLRGRHQPPTSTLICLPSTCAADAPSLVLNGTIKGDVPAQSHPYVLIQVHSTGKWFLGPVIGETTGDGQWTAQVGLDELMSQAKDARFRICIDFMKPGPVQRLVGLLRLSNGVGVVEGDLPPERIQLVCKPASRVENN